MPSVRHMVHSLFPQAQAQGVASLGVPHDSIIIPDAPMLTYVRERTRPSTVPIVDPSGTPIFLTRFIGQGGQARVFLGEREGACYAVKSFHRQQAIDEGNAKYLRAELGVLSNLTDHFPHPFVVGLEWAFAYRENLFLAMHWYPEDLHARLTSERLCRNEGKLYAAQLLAAVEHLHSHCIMHRDIKPTNVLIDAQGNIKLTDFGFALQFDPSVPREMHKTYSRVGTRGYKAPELFTEPRVPISYPTDMYAFGIVFSQILFATVKKEAKHYSLQRIKQSRFPRSLQVFLAELTHPNPLARPDAAAAMNNVWFSSIDWDIIMRCGYQNPYKPTYQNLLSFNVNLKPIRRGQTSPKRQPVHAKSEDLLMGFNYAAPHHLRAALRRRGPQASSDPSETAPKTASSSSTNAAIPEDLVLLRPIESPATMDSPVSSGATLHSKNSSDTTRVVFIEEGEEKPFGGVPLKKQVWSWMRSRNVRDKAIYQPRTTAGGKAVRDAVAPAPTSCPTFLGKGRRTIPPLRTM